MDNDKEITIWDIAKKLNISIATVSRALKDDPVVQKKTKKKILETALEMGYRSNITYALKIQIQLALLYQD